MLDSAADHFQKHCPGCFRRKDATSVCPHCGYDEAAPRSPLFLPHGAVLAGQYRVGKVLGRPGGFGITYLGWDIYLQQRVAIKEYLPPDIAARIPESQDITVHTQDDRKTFEQGKEQFLREARIVARLDHPNVVRVRGFFNANDTAYLVMDYYEGMSLDAYFGQVKPVLDAVVASSLMQMVLDGLDYVHRHGVVHRDIKPNNIYIAAVGKPIILDFGAARQAASGNRSVSVVLTEGYAPMEQYQRHSQQGAWTDVYGVGATLYRMVTGKAPPVVLDRIHRDQLEIDDYAGIAPALKPVLRQALALKPEDRYQSAAAFKLALAIAMGPASSNAPMPVASSSVKDMSTAAPSPQPLPTELLRDTTRRHDNLPDAAITPTTKPLPPILATEPARATPPPAARNPLPLPPTPSTRPDTNGVPRWALPALVVLGAALVAGYFIRPPGSGSPAVAAPAPVAAAPAPAGGSFNAAALPELVSVPAGVRNEVDYPAARMGRAEVTVGEFRAFVQATNYANPAWATEPCEGGSGSWEAPGYAQTDSHPVVCVSAVDAQRYTEWLARETGRKFRLPSDREWEYAAAAGSVSRYWWGNALTEANAVCADCSRQTPSKPWIVASLGSNAWGLYGTASNVREWSCSALPQGHCVAPEQPGERITRGGSWRDPAAALQTDFKASLDKNRRNTWTGFRVFEVLG